MRNWKWALGATMAAGLSLGCDGGALAPADAASTAEEEDVCVDMPEMDMYCTDTVGAEAPDVVDSDTLTPDDMVMPDATAADDTAADDTGMGDMDMSQSPADTSNRDPAPVDTSGMQGMDM